MGAVYWSGTIRDCHNSGSIVASGNLAGGILATHSICLRLPASRTPTIVLHVKTPCGCKAAPALPANIQAQSSVGLLVGHESLPPADKIETLTDFQVENCTCQYIANIPAASGGDITEKILRAIVVKDGEAVVYRRLIQTP